MNFLVTAGNTQVLIDKVRCLTNIFTGRTGAQIALHLQGRGHRVTLLTSHPEVIPELSAWGVPDPGRWAVRSYRTFEDLQQLMEAAFRAGGLDAVVHCAAVSDYLSAGVYAPDPASHFHPPGGTWTSDTGGAPTLRDCAAGKVKSDEPELWLRLVRAPKLVDRIRTDWQFHGVLVKFKLEVGVSEERLLEIGERSRCHSRADLMVANTLEGAATWAYLGPVEGAYHRVSRRELPDCLAAAVEALHEGRGHG